MATVRAPGDVAVHVHDVPGASSVTVQTTVGSFGWRILTRAPTRSGPSNGSSDVIDAVHVGQPTTSLKTSQTSCGDAAISMPSVTNMYQMVQPSARDALLERVLAHVARDGLVDASLRELAARIGTSHRMLLYHFGSREGLVAAVSAAVEARQADALRALAREAASPAELALAMWRRVSAPDVLPFVRIFFEVVPYAIGQRPGTESFRSGFLERWLGLDEHAAAEIRLGVAVVRGLLLDLLVTGDREATDGAMARYATMTGHR